MMKKNLFTLFMFCVISLSLFAQGEESPLSKDVPENLYVIGSATTVQWEIGSALPMEKKEDSKFEYEGMLLYTLAGGNCGELKFVTAQDWGGTHYTYNGDDGNIEIISGESYQLKAGQDPDNKFIIKKNGLYKIVIDFSGDAPIVTFTLIEELSNPKMVGSDSSWSFDNGYLMNRSENVAGWGDDIPNVYGCIVTTSVESETTKGYSDFKFMMKQDWGTATTVCPNASENLILKDNDIVSVVFGDGGSKSFCLPLDKTYLIKLNLNSMQLTVRELDQSEDNTIYLKGSYTGQMFSDLKLAMGENENKLTFEGIKSLEPNCGFGWLNGTNFSYAMDFKMDEIRTLCLPFDVEVPEGCIVQEYTGKDERGVIFEDISGTMKANIPYVVKSDNEGDLIFHAIGVSNANSVSNLKNDYTFTSNYQPRDIDENVAQTYYISDGTCFKKAVSGASIGAFRCYFTVNESPVNAPSFLSIVSKGGAVSTSENIELAMKIWGTQNAIYLQTPEAKMVTIYNVEGSIVCSIEATVGTNVINDLNPGIYLVEKHKVVVK